MLASEFQPAASAPLLSAALERASEAILFLDARGRVHHANNAAAALLRRDLATLIGAELADLGVPADAMPAPLEDEEPADDAADTQPARDEADFACELTIRHEDGSRNRVHLTRYELPAGPTPVRSLVLMRDVTSEVQLRERNALMTSVADRSNRAVVVADHDLNILYTNAAFTSIYGYSAEEALGQQVEKLLVGPCTDPVLVQRLKQCIVDDQGVEEDLLIYDKAGHEIWTTAHVKAHRSRHGKVKYLVGLLSDIRETKQLRSLQQLIMSSLASDLSITTIADQLCRRVEELAPDVVCSILHVDSEGKIHPLGGPSLPTAYSESLDGVAIGPDVGSCGTAAYLGEPVLARDIDTDSRWQPYKSGPLGAGLHACWSTPIKGKDGRVIGTFAFYFRECRGPSPWHEQIVQACVQLGALAIERQEVRSTISQVAYHDMLTGLPNRARIPSMIAEAIKACPEGSHLAVAFLDADNFKDVNDTLGHAAGDEFLVGFANRLRAQIRPGDMLGRLGGDEFVIVLQNRDALECSLAAARITAALAMPLTIGKRQVPMSASMGLSLYPDNATDIETLIKQADGAMYKAKRAGRATYRFFSADIDKLAEERLMHSTALREAIASEALTLHYQPQICTRNGAIHGVEALARWHDPVLGEVSPAKFIPLAEECGLIEQIGVWSIKTACQQMASWRRAGLDIPCISVNLSPINFQNVNLAAVVAQILAANDLPAKMLMLEITEGVILNERATVIATMSELRNMGVGLSLDDFGTGYSSLSRLAQLPIHELKIDRSFMRDFENDQGTRAIVTAVVRVGQSLDVKVVAEGVETEPQRKLLAELGCDAMQGFLFARPMAASAFSRWLLDYSAYRASLMLRQVGRALAQATRPAKAEASPATRPAAAAAG
ncbi:putative diguanylate cyclase (GGDEF)/phosphodiesterase (EAL) with PAS and GAF domains [Bradyrhizobium sp. ORS 285]|uniref:EAL domain-containing protein n=1 Tax=Bradyrhizobium sp. ORS 285 TaxID=115808 RepID=UPI000240AB94|nr:EAL domain-containing protein [Bradyrhizobium sp. ORS 285]CCD86454.1 putative diguanylate cyclase (GGDEF)/phosphodiesterase (EAL) with PAS and GAF domains [Bradyrhizobium sp. ORS 285]SMX62314.1 putative diguanylate cyclase (GGDEF)/phosphodiesterase (EAL) with PAS and GAF domains [Bradyrhizobium sp. ORS 285]